MMKGLSVLARMRAMRERYFDPAIDRLLRRPDAENPLMSALPARPFRRPRTLALRAREGRGTPQGAALQFFETPLHLAKPRLKLGNPLRLPQHQLHKVAFREKQARHDSSLS
jgi:hypothetical protein